MNSTIRTVAQLNWEIQENFNVFTGPAKAYFEFEVAPCLIKRVVYYTWAALSESEPDLCAMANASLQLARTAVIDFDRSPPRPALFWRVPPEIVKDDFEPNRNMLCVHFRVGFWDLRVQERFLRGPYIRREGEPTQYLVRPAT